MTKEHGTRSSYTTGCRCALCRKANADYVQVWREVRKRLSGTRVPQEPPETQAP